MSGSVRALTAAMAAAAAATAAMAAATPAGAALPGLPLLSPPPPAVTAPAPGPIAAASPVVAPEVVPPAARPTVPTARPSLSPAAVPPSAAGAERRSSTVEADGSYRLATARTSDGRRLPVRWEPCRAAITYRVSVAALRSPADRRSALSDAREAVARLSRASGLPLAYLGTTARVPTGAAWSDGLGDADLVVAWVDQRRPATRSSLLGHADEATVLATGGYAYRTWQGTGVIGRGFVVVDAAHLDDTAAGYGPGLTRGNLLLHELGHVAGLAHVADRGQLMHPLIRARDWSGWRAGDKAGLARVGRPAGCLGAPASLWGTG